MFLLLADTIWSIVQVDDAGTLALTQQLAQMRTNSRNEATETIKQTFEVTERDGISTTLSNHHYIFVQSHSQGPQPQIDDTDMW